MLPNMDVTSSVNRTNVTEHQVIQSDVNEDCIKQAESLLMMFKGQEDQTKRTNYQEKFNNLGSTVTSHISQIDC